MKQSEIYLAGRKGLDGRNTMIVGVDYKGAICSLLPRAWGRKHPTLKEAFELINGPIPMYSVEMYSKEGFYGCMTHKGRSEWTYRVACDHAKHIMDTWPSIVRIEVTESMYAVPARRVFTREVSC